MDKKIKMDEQGYNDLLQEISDTEKKLNALRCSAEKMFSSYYACDDFEISEQKELMRKIKDLKHTLRNVIIVTSSSSKDSVDFNSTVKLLLDFGDETEQNVYKLVAHNNIHLSSNEISINSPLGNAILGKKVNDTAQYEANGTINVTILEIIS